MKDLYKTPEIKVEELVKKDVLCASADETTKNGTHNFITTAKSWQAEDYI